MRPVQGVGQRCSRLVRAYTSLPWACAGSSPLPADPSPPSPQLARAPWLRAAEARASPRLASTPPRGAAARARPQHARSTWEARRRRRRRPSRSRGGCSTGDARTPDLPALARAADPIGCESLGIDLQVSQQVDFQRSRRPALSPTSPRQGDTPEGNTGTWPVVQCPVSAAGQPCLFLLTLASAPNGTLPHYIADDGYYVRFLVAL